MCCAEEHKLGLPVYMMTVYACSHLLQLAIWPAFEVRMASTGPMRTGYTKPWYELNPPMHTSSPQRPLICRQQQKQQQPMQPQKP